MPLTRRAILALPSFLFLPRPALSAAFAALVTKVSGTALASLPDGSEVALTVGLGLPEGTRLRTGETLVELALADGTQVNTGRNTTLALEAGSATTASAGSAPSFSISGIAVVDRRGTGAATPLAVKTDRFEVLLADSQVFLDSLARPGVLVQDGTARVTVGTEEIVLAAGEGVDLPLTDAPPAIARWSPERVAEAFASVGLAV